MVQFLVYFMSYKAKIRKQFLQRLCNKIPFHLQFFVLVSTAQYFLRENYDYAKTLFYVSGKLAFVV